MINLDEFFGSLTAAASAVTIVTGYVLTYIIKSENNLVKQITSWVIAIALAFVGQWKGIGIFADTDLLHTILNGLGVGLIANGIFTLEFVQGILAFIGAKKEK